ncbi:glycosyl transferase, family 8 [Streptococcus pneumoniae]|nr:glycosyl transferase, family 8 [Streptococcus pneumoniae]VLA22843.1 glycosyl transferase, family 8 [Streptococcus pneumoniae]VPF74111.1 glycosyl transferase, family 8 [Streptococcus pneumoniae]VSJ47923.1 glycosyl transferase, family 8 [Streptococcus pneumoniae]
MLEVEHLEFLIRELPDWHFHIASPVYCASALTNLSIYKNVTIYQNIIHKRIEWLLDDATVYLDINHGAEVLDVLSKARDRGVKIFTFDNTRKSSEDSLYDGIFSVERPDDLVDRMKNIEIE